MADVDEKRASQTAGPVAKSSALPLSGDVRFLQDVPLGEGRQPWRVWQIVVVALAVFLSLPAQFTVAPNIGIDPSWIVSLQVATLKGRVFGREFVFTYGPLGYLLMRGTINPIALLLHDVFVLGSLGVLYGSFVRTSGASLWGKALAAAGVLGTAVLVKVCLTFGPGSVQFTILAFWLWRVYAGRSWAAVVAAIAAAELLLMGKVSYGVIALAVVPAFALGLALQGRAYWRLAAALLVGLVAVVLLSPAVWHIDLAGYLRYAGQLITGYNEAMALPRLKLSTTYLAVLGLGAGSVVAALLGLRRYPLRTNMLLLPLIALLLFLLFKNAYVRADNGHYAGCVLGFPLVLALWAQARPGRTELRVLLLLALPMPLSLLATGSKSIGDTRLADIVPTRYFRSLAGFHADTVADLGRKLAERAPELRFPEAERAAIGASSVDVFPWESSLMPLNGLNDQARPVPQSYSAYTAGLDGINAAFFRGPRAPDLVLMACAADTATDDRPFAWDEAYTKLALSERYVPEREFPLQLKPAKSELGAGGTVLVLRRGQVVRPVREVRRLPVVVEPGVRLVLPTTENQWFLKLDIERSLFGRVRGTLDSPRLMLVTFEYADGSHADFRAVLPVVAAGVPVSYRVESYDEIRNCLAGAISKNMAVRSVTFHTADARDFKFPITGELIEYAQDPAGAQGRSGVQSAPGVRGTAGDPGPATAASPRE